MDPLSRRKMLVRMGITDPIPPADERRRWQIIDDRVIPEGEADGEFNSHVTWVHKASSWIGWTGAKCYDAKDRICRKGGDFARARDEDAFPVRWYLPHRFPPVEPLLKPSALAIIRHLLKTAGNVAPRGKLPSANGKGRAAERFIKALIEAGFIDRRDDEIALTPYGIDEGSYEVARHTRSTWMV